MLLSVVLTFCAFTVWVEGVDKKTKCDVSVKHYEEFGCKPVFDDPKNACPTFYDCAKFESRSGDKCFYQGKEFNRGDQVDSDLISRNCLASCFCNRAPEEQRRDFNCAHIDCPEFFGNRLQPGCMRQYDLNSCCSKGSVCPPFDKLAKCEVNGKTYYEGQRFEHPDNECSSCVCKPGYTGKFEKPFCEPYTCATEINHAGEMRRNCAPVYYGNGGCCPIQWQCPTKEDQIIPGNNTQSEDKVCKYGETTLKIGDKVIPQKYSEYSPDVECECRIPPLIVCSQKPSEPN